MLSFTGTNMEKKTEPTIKDLGIAGGLLGQAFLGLVILTPFVVMALERFTRATDVSSYAILALVPWSLIGIAIIQKVKDKIDKGGKN